MFLHVSVILSTGGVVSQHALQVSRPTPRGEVEGSGWGSLQAHTRGQISGPTPGGSPGPQWGVSLVHTRGGLQAHMGGALQAHTQGGVCISQHALRQTPPADGYCCGRYASYWNAFLLTYWATCGLIITMQNLHSVNLVPIA